MSPALLRRYRAERYLRNEFEEYRGKVIDSVRSRLRTRGVSLDLDDLEECYTQAWQGLFTALLQGEVIESRIAWLKVVCYRRAIDEHRTRFRERQLLGDAPDGLVAHVGHVEPDLAGDMENRVRLRHTFEALCARLDARERQAAGLCYLQGLTRAQAAAQMGIGEKRMRKLMEGNGSAMPGVAAKVDELLRTIRAGGWCEQQTSLMRALAFGILDPEGERYRLAELHRRECPACRAYVLSLRGLAAVLPPLGLPLGHLAAGLGGGAGAGSASASTGGATGATGGAAGATGGAAGAAGGTSVLASGSLAAKLVTGCLLLAGVGGSCAALIVGSDHKHRAAHGHDFTADRRLRATSPSATLRVNGSPVVRPARRSSSAHIQAARPRHLTSSRSLPPAQAQRELGFERPSALRPTPSAQRGAAGELEVR
jgi:RNA polymerase sigma factor (sigma-70 family)